MLKHLKPGDRIFVVKVKRRGRPDEGTWETVSRVGRKYGYFLNSFHRERQFSLETGKSVHVGHSSRRYGYGFDVHVSEDAWKHKKHTQRERMRLQSRLITQPFGRLANLQDETIAAIHEVLDKFEGQSDA